MKKTAFDSNAFVQGITQLRQQIGALWEAGSLSDQKAADLLAQTDDLIRAAYGTGRVQVGAALLVTLFPEEACEP